MLARLAVVQAHDRLRRDALAGAGLADDAEGLAALDGEGDAVDGADEAVLGGELDLEVADLEVGAGGARRGCRVVIPSLTRGSMTAYRRSTIRLATMMNVAVTSVMPTISGRSASTTELSGQGPEARAG